MGRFPEVEHFHSFGQIWCILQNSAIIARFYFLVLIDKEFTGHSRSKINKQNHQKIREKMKKIRSGASSLKLWKSATRSQHVRTSPFINPVVVIII
jgi:hypothetical protein